MRINHDADPKSLIEKYGVKPKEGRARYWKRVQGDNPTSPTEYELAMQLHEFC